MDFEQDTFNVLIVDDEPHIAQAVEFLMRKKGFQTRTAYDGEAALAAIQEEHYTPNLIILDVMMPGMTGFEVAQKVRSNPRYQDMLIVFLTAKGTPKDKNDGYSMGGDYYLTKPFENHELVDLVSEMLHYG